MTDNSLLGREQFESAKVILRERQVWLQRELQPLFYDLYNRQQMDDMEKEFTLIDQLLFMWEVNPY